jgi:SAM-dependent methyltransferase
MLPPSLLMVRVRMGICEMANNRRGNHVIRDELTYGEIRAMVSGFRVSRIILTGFELGVFTALGHEELSAAEIAGETGADPRALDRLMNALCALGLLTKQGERFRNRAAAERYLVEGSPDYLAGLGHHANLWHRWSTLTDAVRAGTSVETRPVADRGEEWLHSFIGAMHDRGSRQAPAIITAIDLTGVGRVLDLGGGPGDFAMAFVRAHESITATVFDLPNVIPLTRDYIEAEGLSDRVDTLAGDFLVDDIGSGYDLIFLSAIVHSRSPGECRLLLHTCADALEPGGRIVISDWVMSEDRTEPVDGAIFALNMLVNTVAGDSYTESELHAWLGEAGLTDICTIGTEFGAALVLGRKPDGNGT